MRPYTAAIPPAARISAPRRPFTPAPEAATAPVPREPTTNTSKFPVCLFINARLGFHLPHLAQVRVQSRALIIHDEIHPRPRRC